MYTESQANIIANIIEEAKAVVAYASMYINRAKAYKSQAVRPFVENKVTAGDLMKASYAAKTALMPLCLAFDAIIVLGDGKTSDEYDNMRTRLDGEHFPNSGGQFCIRNCQNTL